MGWESRKTAKARRQHEMAQRIRDRNVRRSNRKHAIEHPVSHLFLKVFGR